MELLKQLLGEDGAEAAKKITREALTTLESAASTVMTTPAERAAQVEALIQQRVEDALKQAAITAKAELERAVSETEILVQAEARQLAEQVAAAAKADKEQAIAQAVAETTARVRTETTAANAASLQAQFNALSFMQRKMMPSGIDLTLGTKPAAPKQ